MKETPHARFWMADGLLFFVFKPIVFLDYSTARHIVNERLLYQQHVSCPVVCHLEGILNFDKSARDYLTNEGLSLVKAVAIVEKRPSVEVLLRIYLKRSRPMVPFQIFQHQEDAINYLKAYR